MKDYTEDHKDIKYRFIKVIPSTTKVTAWHIKVDGENYQIVSTPLPRLYTVVFAYKANRSGKVIEYDDPLVSIKTDDLNEGVEELINVLDGNPTKEKHKIPRAY